MRKIDNQKKIDEENFYFQLPFNSRKNNNTRIYSKNSFTKKQSSKGSTEVEANNSLKDETTSINKGDIRKYPPIILSCNDVFDYKYINTILTNENYLSYTIVKNALLKR